MNTAVSTPAQKRAQTACIHGHVMGNIPRSMLVGAYFVAFANQVLGFTDAQITWFLSLIPLVVLVRYPFLDLIRQTPRIYPTLVARGNSILWLGVLLLLPTGWFSLPLLLGVATIFMIGNEFLQNAVAPGLINEITTRSDRGRFFGRMRTAKMVPGLLFAVLGFLYVGDQMSRTEHQILLVIAMTLATYAFFSMAKIPANPPPDAVRNSVGKGQFWTILRTAPLLRRPLALLLVDKVLSWPIMTVYLIGTLNLPANIVMLQVVVGMFGGICSVFLWGKKADRTGFRNIYASYFLASIVLFPLIFFVPDFDAVPHLGSQWLVGIGTLMISTFLANVLVAGHDIAASMYHTNYVNGPNGFHALNMLTAIGALAQAVLTAIGGFLLLVLARGDLVNASADGAGYLWIDPFRVVSVLIITLICLLGWWIARGIDEG